MNTKDDIEFEHATRKALFGGPEDAIPGAGRSAADTPRRHVRCKVTMNIDGDLINYFKQQAAEQGRSYQLLINEALRQHLEGSDAERLAKIVGQILIDDPSFAEQLAKKVTSSKIGKKRQD